MEPYADHAAGWSIGEIAALGRGLVSGTNGENRIHAVGESQAAAWEPPTKQAAAVGMLALDLADCRL
jgi:hypothetical protein